MQYNTMTLEQNKEFNEKLEALLKEYKVNIVPTIGLRLEGRKEVIEEAKIVEQPAA